MKLAKLRIENFRHLGTGGKPFELDFTDALGRIRDFTLLVGPNTCGKTTVLDAIAAALGPSLEMPTLRQGLKLSPRTIVSRGALHAKVTCWLRFDDVEIQTTKEIFSPANAPDVSSREAILTWTYPDPQQQSDAGGTDWNVQSVRSLLRARNHLVPLLATNRFGWGLFQRVGGVFTFDQERTSFGRTVSRHVWNIIHGTTVAATVNQELQTTDPRTVLIDLALRSRVPSVLTSQQVPDPFTAIQHRYAEVCAPHQLVGAVRDELNEFSVRFSDGEREYDYGGLSSGEKMVLLLLIRFVAEQIHRSIVLIDELELNQHPVWQRRILHALPRMGDNNQIIATTHSPYLRGAVSPDAVIDLGNLGDGR